MDHCSLVITPCWSWSSCCCVASSLVWSLGGALLAGGYALLWWWFRPLRWYRQSVPVIFWLCVMALSLLPTAAELAGLGTLDAVRDWSGCPAAVWTAASDHLGTVPSIRVLALTPVDVFRLMLERVRIPVTRAAGATVNPPLGNALPWK